MYCRKCNGRVFVDRINSPLDMVVELFCSMCGKRWFMKKDGENRFASWLAEKEAKFHQSYATSF